MSLSEILLNKEKLSKLSNAFELESDPEVKVLYSKKIVKIENQNIELIKLIRGQDSFFTDEKLYLIDFIGNIKDLEKRIENETRPKLKDLFLESIISLKENLDFMLKVYFTENQLSVLASLNKNDVSIKKYSTDKDYLIRVEKEVEDENYFRAKTSGVDFEGYEVFMSPYKIVIEYFILKSDGSLVDFSKSADSKILNDNFLSLTYLFEN